MDPRVAGENFTAESLAAIVSITGRLIAPPARHPEEQEIAILPGAMLLLAGSVEVPGLPSEVVLLAESGDAPGLPADSAALKAAVVQQVTAALVRPDVTVNPPGRFAFRASQPEPVQKFPAVAATHGSAMERVDNTVVRKADASFAAQPNQATAVEVLRTCMLGDLLLDTTGSDVPTAAGFSAGSRLQIRGGTGPDGKSALLAFTRNEEIARLYPPGTRTMSMVNPATGVLELVKSQHDAWLYIDPAGPTCAVSAAEIDFALRNPNNVALKTATVDLAAGRIERQQVIALLKQEGPLLFGGDETSEPGTMRYRMTAMPGGSPGPFAFPVPQRSSRTTRRMPSWLARPARLSSDGYGGLIINPSGPYVAVPLAELDA
jgi:hypothetical protein